MSKRSPLLAIFLIVLVDVFGFTIVIPTLSFYALHFGASPLVATLIVSVYAACSLISTPVIGKLSDIYGRKPLLLYSQLGTLAGFLILAFSKSLWMVFLGRILPGISAGNLSIAQAYISDHTPPEDRTKAFGVIGVAFGIGFLAGPGLGGWLGQTYGLHVPFIVASGFSLTAIIFTMALLTNEPPTNIPKAEVVGPGGRRPSPFDIKTYATYLKRPAVRALFAQYFLFSFAFSCFFSGFALFAFLNPHFKWDVRHVGYIFAFSGLLGIILQGGLLGRLVKRYGEFRLSVMAFGAALVAYSIVGFATTAALLYIAATINAFGQGTLRPVLTARLTQAVGKDEQGVVLGISGSLSSVAMLLAPPTGGVMLNNGYIWGWTAIPAVVSLLGLIAVLAWAGVTEKRASTAPAAELSSGA